MSVKTFSLPRSHRLQNAEAFTSVFHYQHQLRGDFVQIYARPNGQPFSRLGLVVSRKVERSAVRRNRVKRLLRETFRTFQINCNTVKMDWVMRLRRPITSDISTEFVAEVRILMRQLQQCHD
ncbi:MAG: ribonuclease P protein component [Burkholderiales bacterium]|nr:ribonuclease P protein component [Nitrosomonas sp.]MCP5276477.1 ribonuclease P protein component [Burkholderiales bacterium]